MNDKKNKTTETTPPEVPTFGFGGFFVSKILFQEGPKLPLAEGETITAALTTHIKIRYGLSDDGKQAEVRFTIELTSDPRDKPYQIEVEVVGQFTLKTGPRTALEQFCKTVAPTMLFPYVREIIHRVTQDGRHGVLRLDPVNLHTIVKPDGWADESPKKAKKAKASSNAP